MIPKCISCGHTDLIDEVTVIDQGENHWEWPLSVKTSKNRHALLFKGARRAEVQAKVCPACGLVMMYVTPKGVATLRGRA